LAVIAVSLKSLGGKGTISTRYQVGWENNFPIWMLAIKIRETGVSKTG